MAKSWTIDNARQYEENRFERDAVTRRLDAREKAFAARLMEQISPESEVLDVPSGNGRFFHIFKNVKKLTLVDLSDVMLEVLRGRVADESHVDLIQASITELPFADASFDLTFTMRLFHHMKDDGFRRAAFAELSRVSRKYVAMSFYNKRCWKYYRKAMLGKKIRGNYVTYGHIVKLAEEVGLRPVFRMPGINIVEKQCMVLFEKTSAGA